MPKKCVDCADAKGKNKFSTAQWKKASGACLCIECSAKQKAEAPQATIIAPNSVEEKKEPIASPLQRCCTCNKASAELFSCSRCKVVAYCGPECQRKGWPKHKTECKQIQKLKQVCTPDASSGDEQSGGAPAHASGGGAAAAAARPKTLTLPVAHSTGCDDEFENPCPVCLDNEDDANVDGNMCGMCTACGQSYCGACKAGGLQYQSPN